MTNASQMQSKSQLGGGVGEKSTNAVSHAEWYRKKEHEEKLKEQLITEAKKDLIE